MIDFDKMFSELNKRLDIDLNTPVDFTLASESFRPVNWEYVFTLGDSRIDFDETGIFLNENGIKKRVIVYIRDWTIFNVDNQSLPKYHLIWCTTLKQMYNQNKFSKYVASTNTNGKFKINLIIDGEVKPSEENLQVCKHCLKKMNWQNYKNSSNKNEIYQNFNLQTFFKEYNINLIDLPINPKYTDENAPLNNYTDDWHKISAQMKRLKNYTCEDCGQYFPNGKGLHVHHINTMKSDNRPSNLQVLCPNCHQKKHNHNILKTNWS